MTVLEQVNEIFRKILDVPDLVIGPATTAKDVPEWDSLTHIELIAAIEKQLNDGEQQRWAPVAQLTGFGTTTGSTSLLREVRFTVRDLIRQEP